MKQTFKPPSSVLKNLTLLFFLSLITTTVLGVATLPQVGVVTKPSGVQQQQVTMNIYTQLVTPIPSTGSVVITLPPEMSISSSTFTCTMNIPTNVLVSSCTQGGTTGNQITATFNKALPSGSFEIQINNAITNPTSTTPTSSFQFYTYNGVQVLDSLTLGINLIATVGSFVNTKLTSESQVVGQMTNLYVTFTGSHKIPANGQIMMTFPIWNPQAIAGLQQQYLQGAISCQSMDTTVLSANIQCSFSNSVLTVTNLGTTDIAGGKQVAFKVINFRNPLSTSLVSGFQLLTQDSTNGNIDISTSTPPTLQISTPAVISNAAFTVDPSTDPSIAGIVGETNVMQISFSSPVPLNIGCNIIVTLPAQFNLASIQAVTISGLLGTYRKINPTMNGLTMSFPSCLSYTSNSLQGIISINSLVLPGSAETTGGISIAINDLNNNQIAVTQSGPTFTPTPGTGLQVTFTASPNVILSSTELTIQVTPQRTLGMIGQFVLQFPSTYVINNGACSVFQSLTPNFVSSSAICMFSGGNTLTVSNFNSQTIPKNSNTVLSFKVGMIKLPSTMTNQTFQAWNKLQDSQNQQYYIVEQFNSIIVLNMSYGSIAASIIPYSYTAFQNTNYTFSITPQHDMQQNSYIIITYPLNITIPDTSFSQSQCRAFINFPTTPTCVINPTARTITINNGFRVGISPGGTTYSFNMPGFLNPLTLDPTGTFSIQTQTLDGSIMDVMSQKLTLTMQNLPFIQSMIVTPGQTVNSALTSYTFIITPTVPVNNSYSLLITFPVEIGLPTDQLTYQCTSPTITSIKSVVCTNNFQKIPNQIRVQIQLNVGVAGINPLQAFSIIVNNVRNPTTTKPSQTFNLQIVDKNLGLLSSLNTVTVPVTVMMNTPSTLTLASFSANTTGAGQNAQYTITIFPQHVISAGGGILVIYPSQIGVQQNITANVTSINSSSVQTVSLQQSARQIMISNAFSSNQGADNVGVTIKIAGFINPLYNTNQTNSFIVMTMNIDNSTSPATTYFIDQVTNGLLLNSPCDYPCSTCIPNMPSVCQSCYQTSELNKLQGFTCVSQCSTGMFYNATSYACQNCSSSCLACTGNANNCTQCGIGNLLYLYNNTCKSNCPGGYVEDSTNNVCSICLNNCKTCQFTQSTCTSCFTNTNSYPYFYQQNCYGVCPINVSVPTANYQCTDCDSNCKTCSGTTTNCTSCLSYMRFDQVKQTCTSVCQENLQIYDQSLGICDYCDSNCATCAGNTTTCTTCNSSLVLNTDNTCQTNCSQINQIPLQGLCQTCQLPCSECSGDLNHCTQCQGEYLLYNSTCIQYCPTKYVSNNATNTTAQCIYQGLICPDGFHMNDAGDGCIPNLFQCPQGYIINQQKTACVPGPGSIVPFPFLFLSACLSILVVGSYIKDKFFTKVYTNLIALIGMQELLIYGLMVCYSGANSLWLPFILSLVGFIMLIASNISFYLFYKKTVIQDVNYMKWCRLYPKTEKYLSLLTVLLNFKSIKFVYSGFYGLESCLAQFEDPLKNFFRPMRLTAYFSFIFVYLPIIAADILIFFQVEWGYQLLILAIESFILAITITILTLIEFRHPERLLMSGDEQYIRIKPKNFDGISMDMGAMVDVDEGTLIRSKMVDDDYEIQLRKRALVQILDQVGRNFLQAQTKGVHLGKDLDKCMTKFDGERIKLRRAFSLEEIDEEAESWIASGDEHNDGPSEDDEIIDIEDCEFKKQRRYSYPLSPRSNIMVPDPRFKAQILEIQDANKEFLQDNVYAECKPADKTKETKRKKTISRRTQTYLRELLMMDGDTLQDSDLEVILDDEAQIDLGFAQGLIDGVIDGLSESESVGNLQKKKMIKRKKQPKLKDGVPDFELVDIMGEFEIDDLGNFIILRGERGELLDRRERRVNRRGYLIDRFGNVMNKNGQIIFKAVELESDDEIPAPFGFEKRKKNLLSLGDEGEFRVQSTEKQVMDDEDLIDRELKAMRKSGRKRKHLQDGQILEEEGDDSSVDSLMAESPAKYALNKNLNENDMIDKVTQKKVPKKRPPPVSATIQSAPQVKRIFSTKNPRKPGQQQPIHDDEKTVRPRTVQSSYVPPRRIKREDTKELFPTLAIESIEQRKLFKIAESIGGMANQIADAHSRYNQSDASILNHSAIQIDHEQLERIKQEHFKDIMNESQIISQHNIQKQNHKSEVRLPPRAPVEKVYGNLNDVIAYEERMIEQQMRGNGQRPYSPASSRITAKRNTKQDKSQGRKMTGLESIYLQKFDKTQGTQMRQVHSKAKFRNTINQFVDDPELLADDGIEHYKSNEMSMMVAKKLDRLQKQYVTTNSANRLSNLPITSMGFSQVPGGLSAGGFDNVRKIGSSQGLNFNNDVEQLDPVMKGNWMNGNSKQDNSVE